MDLILYLSVFWKTSKQFAGWFILWQDKRNDSYIHQLLFHPWGNCQSRLHWKHHIGHVLLPKTASQEGRKKRGCVTNQRVKNVLCHFSVCGWKSCRYGTLAPIISEMELEIYSNEWMNGWMELESSSQFSDIWTQQFTMKERRLW